MNDVSDRYPAVAPKSGDHLEMTVREPGGGETRSVQVTDLNIGECEFFCPADTPLVLPLGSRAELRFSTKVLKEPHEILAKVVFRCEAEGGRRYRIRFPQLHRLPASVYALFNRRSSYRVKPLSRAQLGARIRVDCPDKSQREVAVLVKDISISGIGVELGTEHEADFAGVDTIVLDLLMPHTDDGLQLVGKIRNRRLQDDRLVYGVEFDSEQSNNFLDQQATISEYVLSVLQAELKHSGAENSRLGTFL